MKSRSHRLAVDQKDDWVEESWTVDCSCGVNFDDGEEMVDCDDCGVWVHTRCSRYVKTDNSFVCDKCKNNDSSEETEVAQLLVELPTKTVPLPSPPCTSSAVTSFVRPFKRRSIKDRVHVQGIPGDAGDPDLFSGISAVFGPQLWKCSGYIPKKFNFKYRDFPYEEMIEKKDSGIKSETRTDDGAGALLSLAQLDVEKQPEEEGHRFVAPRESGFNSDRLTPKNEVGKDTSSMKPPSLHFEKRTREDPPNIKDRSGKKKVRLFEKDGDCGKRIRLHSPDRGHMAAEIDPHCGRSENSSYNLPTSHLSHDPVVVDHAVDAQKSNSKESNSKEDSRQPLPLKLDGFSKTTTGASPIMHSSTSGCIPVEEEVASISAVTPEVLGGSGGSGMQQAEQVHENSAATGSKEDGGGSAPNSLIYSATSFRELHAKSNSEPASGSKIVNVTCNLKAEDDVSDTTITGSVTLDLKAEDDFRRSEVVDLHKRRVDGESPSTAVDPDKSNVMASAAGSVTTPSQILMLMSSASEYCNTGATGQSESVDSKQKLVQESSLNGAEDEVRHEKAGKLIKEHSKSALTSVPKSSQLKKISHAASVSRKTPCDLRDSALESSSSPTPHASHATSEPSNGQQKLLHESASNLHKIVTVLQSSSKVSNTLTHSAAPSNSPAALSDEELALLLHQELNSSPRVPRVPRMRNSGSLPQLPSPTAASVLMKRTSSTGGKDHVLAFSRRKTKDLTGQSSGETEDESKKMDRISSPKDTRKQDSAFISDSVGKREAESGSGNSIKKSRRFTSGSLSATAEANEYNYSSSRLLSPKIPSDEEKGGGTPIIHRTLPGLLAEIMREGKRMTYEELCNSVLPHWPYLRKHNGERYAYSSHSQAVLDCLRNRHEWARLVDRGPKTSAGRKRRKADAEESDGRREHEDFPKGKRKARKRKRLQQPKSDEMSDASYSDMSLSNDASDGTYN